MSMSKCLISLVQLEVLLSAGAAVVKGLLLGCLHESRAKLSWNIISFPFRKKLN